MSRRGRATFPAVFHSGGPYETIRYRRDGTGVCLHALFSVHDPGTAAGRADLSPLPHRRPADPEYLLSGIHNDLPDLFAGFQWKQFAFICLGCVGYMLLMHVAGFYIASICYLVGTLAFLRVPRWHIVLTVVVMAALIYAVFTLFLKVPLPVGLLFK